MTEPATPRDHPTDRIRAERSSDGIVTITFDHPSTRNSLDGDAMSAFAALVEGLADRAADDSGDSVRVVVLRGARADAFCSGGDQRALADDLSEAAGNHLARVMGDALGRLESLPVPVIAAVDGYALGGGAEIALAADMRIVGADVRFGMVHRRLDLIPGWGGGQRLMRLVGYSRALHILLEARTLNAPEMVHLGIANETAAAGEAARKAAELAHRIASMQRATVRDIKGLLRDGLRLTAQDALHAERDRFPPRWASDAHRVAVESFDEGRRAGRTADAATSSDEEG